MTFIKLEDLTEEDLKKFAKNMGTLESRALQQRLKKLEQRDRDNARS